MNAKPPTSPPADDLRQPDATGTAPPRFRFALLFQIWLAVVLMGTVVTLLLPEWFTSTARIKIERDQTDLRGFAESPAPSPAYDPYFLQTEFEIIQSETILGRVIDGSNLNEKWGQKYFDGGKLKTSESLSVLRGRLDLRPVRNTTLLDIRVFSEDANEARDLANAIAATYRQWRQDQACERVKAGLRSLEERAKEQDEKIARTREELASFSEPIGNEQPANARRVTYVAKQKALEEMMELRRLLTRRINLEDIDLRLPRSAQVMIIERAVASTKPLRPNVAFNIWASILIGALVGFLLTALVYLLQRRAYRRQSGRTALPGQHGFRTFLRVIIALVVGGIVGYNCAMPWSTASILLTQLVVFLGGIAIAFVELAKTTPLPAPPSPAPKTY